MVFDGVVIAVASKQYEWSTEMDETSTELAGAPTVSLSGNPLSVEHVATGIAWQSCLDLRGAGADRALGKACRFLGTWS